MLLWVSALSKDPLLQLCTYWLRLRDPFALLTTCFQPSSLQMGAPALSVHCKAWTSNTECWTTLTFRSQSPSFSVILQIQFVARFLMHIWWLFQVAIVKFTKQLCACFEFSVLHSVCWLCLLVMQQVHLFSCIGRRVWDGQGLFSASGYSAAALSPFWQLQ